MSDDREVWEMEPKGMMEYFQSSKHKIGESIADLVDNAFDAGAQSVEIEVSWYGDEEKPTSLFSMTVMAWMVQFLRP